MCSRKLPVRSAARTNPNGVGDDGAWRSALAGHISTAMRRDTAFTTKLLTCDYPLRLNLLGSFVA